MLKKTSPLLLLWTLLALACTSTPEKPSPAQIAAARQEVKDMLASIAEPVQKFTVSGESVEIIQGKHGTTVYVDPDFLETVDGSPLGERIQVELLELTSVEQMLLHNAQTVSDGQLLETGGAYHLQMSSGGRALQIKPGEQLAVQFPRLTDEPMQLFMGERDSLQSMNWKPTDQPFRSAGLLPKPLSEGVFLPVANRTAFSAPNFQDTISSNVDSTLLDTDSSYWREEGSEAHHYRQLYQVMGINKMGWINCDRFWDDPTPKRSIEIEIENQDLEYVDLFLVFEDINSLMSGFSFDGQPARFSGLPSGRQVTLIVFSVMEDTPYLYKKSFQTQDFAKTEIELVPTTLEQLANQMEEL